MLHADNEQIRKLLLKGNFGLEKESLRVYEDGFLAHSQHPFPDDNNIVRDFCENQTEINTPVLNSAEAAIQSLDGYYRRIQKKLSELEPREYLWPFSNPPYIRNEEDIPIARFYGGQENKTKYREYLSNRYGRYKMSFSGIHFNYSFDDELLREDFKLSGQKDFLEYKNSLYVELAQKAAAYGWIIVAITAASPLMDGSFVEKKRYDENNFNGMASTRCSELGYWNYFAPIFNYSDIKSYADSIQQYVDDGWLSYPSELYYPIRLKPAGENNLNNLREKGVNHIELRMFDLNPLVQEGVEEKDVIFAQLFLVWLASVKMEPLTTKDQIQAVQNFKNAAHYDLKTVKIVLPDGEVCSAAGAALSVLERMKEFYETNYYQENIGQENLNNKDLSWCQPAFSRNKNDIQNKYDLRRKYPAFYNLDDNTVQGIDIRGVLAFEEAKFTNQENRYAWKIRKRFGSGYVKKGLLLAKRRQELAITDSLHDFIYIR